MALFHYSGFRGLALFIRAAACLISLASLLAFSAPRPYQFRVHFRSTNIGRQVERRSFVDQSKSDVSEEIVANYRQPGKIPVLGSEQQKKTITQVDSNEIRIPLTNLVLRLKLGSSPRAPTDPLL